MREFFVVKIDLYIGHCAFSQLRYRPNCVSQLHFVGPQELGFKLFLMAVTQIAADNRNEMSNIWVVLITHHRLKLSLWFFFLLFLLPFLWLLVDLGGGGGVEEIG